jgi:hypothetical protein
MNRAVPVESRGDLVNYQNPADLGSCDRNNPPPFYESSMSAEKSLLDLTGPRDAFA